MSIYFNANNLDSLHLTLILILIQIQALEKDVYGNIFAH